MKTDLIIVFVAVAEHDASPLFQTVQDAQSWIKQRNPNYGSLLYKIEQWQLTQQEIEELSK